MHAQILHHLTRLGFDEKVALGLALLLALGFLWAALPRRARRSAPVRVVRHLDALGSSPVGSLRRPGPHQVAPRRPAPNRLAA